MDDASPIRDPTELRERLAALTFDLRTLDLIGFRRWLDLLMARWANDPVFVQRLRIRDLRRALPELQALEGHHQRALAADAESEHGPRLRAIERTLYNTGRAIAGLTEALAHAQPERRPALEAKRHAFQARRQLLEVERTALTRSSPARQELLRAAEALDRCRAEIGLDAEEATLAGLLNARGRGSGRAGNAFEDEAFAITEAIVVPELAVPASDVSIVRSVRLGAAGVELDVVVVRRTGGPDEPVEVLAVIEAKRNINDLAHGFLRRQIDLAWLTGDRTAYDTAVHRTGFFDAGHFDRPAAHWQDGHPFVFDSGSFRGFVRDQKSGHFLAGLYLVARAGPIWGLSGAALSRVAASVSTDEDWNPDDDSDLARLFAWARSLAGSVEAPDVIRLYTTAPGQQLLVTR